MEQHACEHMYLYHARENTANQSRSQSFVLLDQGSENESSGSIHFQITMELTKFCLSGSLRSLHLWRIPEMVAPRALVSRPLVKGNEALGTRLTANRNTGKLLNSRQSSHRVLHSAALIVFGAVFSTSYARTVKIQLRVSGRGILNGKTLESVAKIV